MSRKLVSCFLVLVMVLSLCSCSNHAHKMPDDFDISFQFGESDAKTITIDTYNGIITLGPETALIKTKKFKMSEEDRRDIYDELIDDHVQTFEGDFRGDKYEKQPNVVFSVKYTIRKKHGIASGNYTTANCKKRDCKTLAAFRDYMIEYVKQLPEAEEFLK